MSRFTILLGGELVRTPRLDAQIAGSRVIAADSGIRHAAALGLAPELWVGDFDSVPKSWRTPIPMCRAEVFPAEKDKTDGELAIEQALGARRDAAWSWPAPSAARAPTMPSSILRSAVRLAESGIAVAADQRRRRKAVPLLSGTLQLRLRTTARCSRSLASPRSPGLRFAGVKWPLNGDRRRRSAPRSPSPTRSAAACARS